MIDFPASPTNGQVFTSGNSSWVYDGTKWVAGGASTILMPPLSTGDNRLINGDMRIDQRNNGAGGTANNVYTADRWGYASNQASKATWQRISTSVAPGFPYAFGFISSSAYASLAGDNFGFYQRMEADMVSDFQWGAANAQPVTLSFWAFSSLTGTFSGAIQNQPSPGTRSYPFTYQITAANTWQKFVIIIPGDTAGTWVMSGNAAGVMLIFDLGSGSTARGPANAWATTASPGYYGATGAVSVVGTNGATFYVTGVKLEVGSVATPFNRQSLAKSMADCQRYYQTLGGSGNTLILQGYAAAGQTFTTSIGINAMRAVPTATIVGSFSVANVSSVSLFPALQIIAVQLFATSTAGLSWSSIGTSYLTLSAEL